MTWVRFRTTTVHDHAQTDTTTPDASHPQGAGEKPGNENRVTLRVDEE